jgi:thiamine biosynthesis lipoprotein
MVLKMHLSRLKKMPLPNSWQFQAIGTDWTIQTSAKLTKQVKVSILELIELFNGNYSRFQSDSIVRKMYNHPGVYTFTDSSFPELYALYSELCVMTDGAVTPLVGKILSDAGYDENYQLGSFSSTSIVPSLNDIVWDGKYTITVNQEILLDFGAAAKGLLVDRIATRLKEAGMPEWYIDGSGDSALHASSAYVIGLEHPLDTTKILGTTELFNESICASATNRRAWKNGHHVIDGRTGQPTNDIIASWVIADSTMLADGLATALFFEWDNVISAYPEASYLRMHASGIIEMNQAMKERITLFN